MKWSLLARNCLLKHVTEGSRELMGRRGRRRKQLLDRTGDALSCSVIFNHVVIF